MVTTVLRGCNLCEAGCGLKFEVEDNRIIAVQPDEVLGDPALEARARALSRELRCMVCQNQSIDDSDAPLARDLRLLVRERLQGGDAEAARRGARVAAAQGLEGLVLGHGP